MVPNGIMELHFCVPFEYLHQNDSFFHPFVSYHLYFIRRAAGSRNQYGAEYFGGALSKQSY